MGVPIWPDDLTQFVTGPKRARTGRGVEATLDAERLDDHARAALDCISTTVAVCFLSNVAVSVMQQAFVALR